MTSSEDLSHVRICLYEPLSELGAPMAAMLRTEGFKATEHIHSLEELDNMVRRNGADVYLLEMDTHQRALLALAKRLRRNRLGPDPFVALIATKSDVTLEDANAFLVNGFDHVLDKPYSPIAVLEHIRDLAHRSRRFVVSGGYSGPEHRHDPSRPRAETFVDVPNRLDALLNGTTVDEGAYRDAVEAWNALLNPGREKKTR